MSVFFLMWKRSGLLCALRYVKSQNDNRRPKIRPPLDTLMTILASSKIWILHGETDPRLTYNIRLLGWAHLGSHESLHSRERFVQLGRQIDMKCLCCLFFSSEVLFPSLLQEEVLSQPISLRRGGCNKALLNSPVQELRNVGAR